MVETIVSEYKTFLKTSHMVDLTLPMHVYMSSYDEDGLKLTIAVRPSSTVSYLYLTAWGLTAAHDCQRLPVPVLQVSYLKAWAAGGRSRRTGSCTPEASRRAPVRADPMCRAGHPQVHSLPSASRSFVNFKQTMLLELGKIVKAHGAGAILPSCAALCAICRVARMHACACPVISIGPTGYG